MSYTIYNLAKDSGVSVATVSRVMNNNGSVKEKTRQRILQIMAEKNFKPNPYARGLNNISMKTIGVVMSDIANPFFAEVIKGITDIFQKNEYNIILCSTENDKSIERREIDLLVNKQVDGFIIAGSRPINDVNASFIIELSKTYPIVLVNSFIKGGTKLFSVMVDEKEAAYKSFNYLVSKDKRDIYLLGNQIWKTTLVKISALKQCLSENNIPFDKNKLIDCDYSYSSGRLAAKELLKRQIPFPYTLFCCSDMIAIGAMREFLVSGAKIPEQVSVMGYSNIEMASLVTPSLTTVDQKMFSLGQKSANLCIDILNDKYPINKKVYSDYELIVREST